MCVPTCSPCRYLFGYSASLTAGNALLIKFCNWANGDAAADLLKAQQLESVESLVRAFDDTSDGTLTQSILLAGCGLDVESAR